MVSKTHGERARRGRSRGLALLLVRVGVAVLIVAVAVVGIGEIRRARWDQEFRERLLADRPELEELLRTDSLEAARVLLDWTSNHLNQTSSPPLDAYYGRQVDALPASRAYFEIFEPNRGGVFCGGMAQFFAKVLHLFDLPGFTVDCGVQIGELTHVTVLVADPTLGEFYLFDPTFNLTLRDREGAFLPVGSAFARDADEIVVDERSVSRRDFIEVTSLLAYGMSDEERRTASGRARAAIEAGETVELTIDRKSSYGLGAYFESWGPALETQGYPKDVHAFLGLLRARVFGVGSMPDRETGAAFRAFLEEHSIPHSTSTN